MKTYYCNESMKFNLDSAYTLVTNIWFDYVQEVRTNPMVIFGRTIRNDLDAYDLREEIANLALKAQFSKVTGKEYGRIKEIQQERQIIRYSKCIESGMDESRASYAFM